MTSTNISIRKEAYDFLMSMKTEDMSFSDVILGFKKDGQQILRFWGTCKNTHIDLSAMKELRVSFNKRLGGKR